MFAYFFKKTKYLPCGTFSDSFNDFLNTSLDIFGLNFYLYEW